MTIRNITHRWAVAGAVAAMLAASSTSAFAQTANDTTPPNSAPPTSTPPGPTSISPTDSNTTTPSATTAPDATAPSTTTTPDANAPSSAATPTPLSGSTPSDYKILSNHVFDYVSLQKARARGLSENQIASVVKIAKETGYSFDTVSAAVERGETFPALATEYGIRLGDVYSVDKEKQDISDYTSLYEQALALGKSNGSNSPISSIPVAPAPMTPAPMSSDAATPATGSSATLDIVDTAMAAKNLTTLVKALQVAGLVETLKGAGPFTVFAPDDKAFSKLPAGALDALLADPAKLKTVLTYHVIPAAVKAADALAMTTPTSPPTVEGATLQVTKGRRGRLKINDATVIKADIEASNGVIHIIDKVLMPPTDTTAPAAPAPMDSTTPAPPSVPDTTTPPAPAPATPDTTTPPATPPAAPDAPAPAPDTTTPPPAPATPPAAPDAPAPAPDATAPPATPPAPAQ